MPDFNKGDFTQQGVDGHVNAKLRLNAKRYVDIDLTSNEQASGCTISGHVYDSLNDITYPIGSGGGGDNLIKCVATLINESGNMRGLGSNTLAILNEDGTLSLNAPVLNVDETKIITFLLVKDAGDRLFCVVTDSHITTSNENGCYIADNCLYPTDETVTECSITITLK